MLRQKKDFGRSVQVSMNNTNKGYTQRSVLSTARFKTDRERGFAVTQVASPAGGATGLPKEIRLQTLQFSGESTNQGLSPRNGIQSNEQRCQVIL